MYHKRHKEKKENNEKKPWYQRWWAILLFIVIIVGVLNSNEETNTSPKKIAEKWAKAVISGRGSEEIFNYLNTDIKEKYSSYDSFNDELANMRNAYLSQGMMRQLLSVDNEQINGNSASVDVKYKTIFSGVQQTHTKTFEFVKKGENWKLKEYYDLSGSD